MQRLPMNFLFIFTSFEAVITQNFKVTNVYVGMML